MIEQEKSLENFLKETASLNTENSFFEVEKDRFLEININGSPFVWAKTGSMVAHYGQVLFERDFLEHGIEKSLKKIITGEGASLMKITGIGKVYLASQNKKVFVFHLNNQSITVNGNDILAFDSNLEWDIKFVTSIAGILSAGLFNVVVKGTGWVAISTHYDPIALTINEFTPVYVDPNAAVAWSSYLKPSIKFDINWKTLIGRSSGETVKMEFSGKKGFVLIQPFEEVIRRPSSTPQPRGSYHKNNG